MESLVQLTVRAATTTTSRQLHKVEDPLHARLELVGNGIKEAQNAFVFTLNRKCVKTSLRLLGLKTISRRCYMKMVRLMALCLKNSLPCCLLHLP